MATTANSVLLVQASEPQELLLHDALVSQGVAVTPVPPYAHLETEITRTLRASPAPLLIVLDLAVLAQLGTSLEAFSAWAREHCPGARLMLTCAGLLAIRPAEQRWACQHGALDLLPGCAAIQWRERLEPPLRTILAALGIDALDVPRLERALAAIPKPYARAGTVPEACARLERLAGLGLSAAALLEAMRARGGVEIADRLYHMVRYPECFVGSEAVDWIARKAGVGREAAVEAGQILLETGAIYHVAREQPFLDGHYFYRFAADGARLDSLDLAELLRRLRGPSGVAITDRAYRGASFPACFVGAEAVDWLVNAAQLSENEAMTLGQRLIDLAVIHHVTDDHGFKDGYFFYRFYQDERGR